MGHHLVALQYTHYTTTHATATTLLHHNYNTTTLQLQLQPQLQLQYIQQMWVRWPTRWPLQPLQPLQKTQLQPPFGPSVDSLYHPWFTTTNLSYRFPIFETSATALCGTTGNPFINCNYPMIIHDYYPIIPLSHNYYPMIIIHIIHYYYPMIIHDYYPIKIPYMGMGQNQVPQ